MPESTITFPCQKCHASITIASVTVSATPEGRHPVVSCPSCGKSVRIDKAIAAEKKRIAAQKKERDAAAARQQRQEDADQRRIEAEERHQQELAARLASRDKIKIDIQAAAQRAFDSMDKEMAAPATLSGLCMMRRSSRWLAIFIGVLLPVVATLGDAVASPPRFKTGNAYGATANAVERLSRVSLSNPVFVCVWLFGTFASWSVYAVLYGCEVACREFAEKNIDRQVDAP